MAGGGSTKDCSCLCGLVGRYLRPHAVALAPSGRLDESLSSSKPEEAAGAPRAASKGAEKDILISLTSVLREIKRWATEVDSHHEQDSGVCSIICGDCPCHMEPSFGCRTCSANTTLLLVVFLAGNNPYVRHMAVKVLVAISDFLMQHVNKWKEFICFLWMSLRVAMNSCISIGSFALSVVHCHLNTEVSTTLEGYEDDTHFAALLQTRLRNSDWLMPAALMQVLRTIQKSLKMEDGGLLESCLHYAIFSLLKMPWNMWNRVFSSQFNESSGIRSAICRESGVPYQLDTNSVFLGALLQLLCSLVEQNELEVGNSPLEESCLYFKFSNIISEILVCCFSNCRKYTSCMYQYLRHKVLVLMIRLSYWPHWRCSSLVSWLELLHNYFKDILNQNITIGHTISVEGSPFLSSVVDGGKVEKICTAHLQRQTIFLFLKCCFTSICFGIQACPECMTGLVTSLTCELQKDGEQYCFDGLSEISDWLRKHVPLDNYADDMTYKMLCKRFSFSFLQLFIDETI